MKKLMILLALLLLTGCASKVEKKDSQKIEEKNTYIEDAKKEKEKEKEVKKDKEMEERERIITSPKAILTGEAVEKANDNRIYGVMIDNHEDARAQYGLSKADIVYEMEAEAGITRYLALFNSKTCDMIGPIRSLRPYFLDALMEYDGVIVRFGGSDDADIDVASFGVAEINGMQVEGSYIWRNNEVGKVAPHNAFSSSKAIKSWIEATGSQKQAQGVFSFEIFDRNLNGDAGKEVKLNYGGYYVDYSYDELSKVYKRFVSGKKDIDKGTGEQIGPKNIIIQIVNYGYMPDGVHRFVENTGQGKGYYITNGKVRKIKWSKASRDAKTVFAFEEGLPLTLNPGQTYVEVFDNEKLYEIK